MYAASWFALGTSVLWAVGPIYFASAGRKVGSVPVNLVRIALGTAVMGLVILVVRLCGVSPGATPSLRQAGWYALSGLLGMAIGDLMNFESMVLVGPRMNVQINCSLVPVLTAGLAWWVGQGVPGVIGWTGLVLVVLATSAALAVAARVRPGAEAGHHLEPRATAWGVLLTVGAACMTAAGMVAGRQASVGVHVGREIDPMMGAFVRLGAACMFLWLVPVIRGRGTVGRLWGVMRQRDVAKNIWLGTIIGPVGGVLCLMAALGLGASGPVSAIVSTSPLWILPVLRWRYGVKLGPLAWVAAAVAVVGVAMITLDPAAAGRR